MAGHDERVRVHSASSSHCSDSFTVPYLFRDRCVRLRFTKRDSHDRLPHFPLERSTTKIHFEFDVLVRPSDVGDDLIDKRLLAALIVYELESAKSGLEV